ncbi:venom allergen-1-like [Haematobia irritans]|uniref:Venom allergen-1 n=1 Tax=Haematobia irritans irritans TaxID=75445 RepID=A0A1B0YYG7_HAEIR|nr:salivary antigen 5 precursor [Haematobia irritans irritans]
MQSFSVFLFSASLLVIGVYGQTDYCSPDLCRNGYSHIACRHNGAFEPSCPSDATMINIDDKLKKVIVKAHNTKRNLIAGGGHPNHEPACRMATMKWDDELAKIAALNVRQCKMAHDKCRNTKTFQYSGQNLAWMGFMGSANDVDMLNKAVNMWYEEVKDSKMQYIKKYPKSYSGPAIGHFTVMVADRNVRVGCAASTYSVPGQPYKGYLVACNYATTNMMDHPIYASCPKAASGCKTGTNKNFPNLCSAKEQYSVNKWY